MAGAIKRFWDHINVTETTGGSATAYTLTYDVAPQSLWNGEVFGFIVGVTSGAGPTLNVNALGDKSLRVFSGSAWRLVGVGELRAGQSLFAHYNSVALTYDIIAGTVSGIAGGSLAGTYPNPSFAVARVSEVRVVRITATGTYTPTADMLYCVIECVGAGGGGGGVQGDSVWISEAAGGGSGGYARKVASAADIGASQAVTIGAVGAGGAAGQNNGAAGGDASVGALCIAKGGSGGGFTKAGVQSGTGGLGGIAGTGDLVPTGAPGGSGWVLNLASGTARGAAGGNSYFGGGGLQSIRTSAGATAGTAGTNYGGGGGGACALDTTATAAGGNGGAGIVIITEYIGTT